MFAAHPMGELFARFDLLGDTILVHPWLQGANSRTLAALLAHEAQHAWDLWRGVAFEDEERVGAAEACTRSEQRANRVELQVWEHFMGTSGKESPENPYEQQLNEELERYRAGMQDYWTNMHEEHMRSCRRWTAADSSDRRAYRIPRD
jgi:hypothetical protein